MIFAIIPDTAQVLMNFLWLRVGQEAIISVNMNICGLGGGQEATKKSRCT